MILVPLKKNPLPSLLKINAVDSHVVVPTEGVPKLHWEISLECYAVSAILHRPNWDFNFL